MKCRGFRSAASATFLPGCVCLLACGDNISPAADGLEIQGVVWDDRNGNGAFDADEVAIPGARVFLDANNDQIAGESEAQARTNAEGRFVFRALPPGDYVVRQDLDVGWRASTGVGQAALRRPADKDATATSPARQHIIGGSDARDMAYPFMASVGERTATFYPFCGAALISDRFVVTAAHCSTGAEPEDVSVMLATNDPSDGEGVRVDVRAIHVHPEYNGETESGYDVAVWELSERLDLTSMDLRTVDLLTPAMQSIAQTGDLATVIGWGVSDSDSPLLQEVHLPVVSEDQCAASYPYVRDFATQICAGSVRGGIDSCQGDSGGPLLVRDRETRRWMHAGITSWGEGCAEAGKPGVYARTSALSEWIHSFLGENSTTYEVRLKLRDVELEFPNQASTRPLVEDLDARWSLSAIELAGVSEGAIAANAGFQIRFFLFTEPDIADQEFTCRLDLDGPGSLPADSISCKSGTNTIGVSGYPDGIYVPELQITSDERSLRRSELVRAGDPPSTEVSGALAITDSSDADYPGGVYFIDYFSIDAAEPGKAVLIELQSSFGGQLGLYDADQRDASGGGILQIASGNESTTLFFAPEADRRYLLGVSSTGTQATGSYTLRMVNSGVATPTEL